MGADFCNPGYRIDDLMMIFAAPKIKFIRLTQLPRVNKGLMAISQFFKWF
jgi:hypothetical protein